MTALPSVRLLEAIADLQSLRQERPNHAQDDVRFQRVMDTLTYLLHCMTGQSHEGEA